MPKTKKRTAAKAASQRNSIPALEQKIKKSLERYTEVAGCSGCYPLLVDYIDGSVVDGVFDDLRALDMKNNGGLQVIVESSGGDIDAAYNLATLFRRYGSKELVFTVPRWAKSAATLLVCAGDRILMSPVAELGPLDPQITELNPLEKRLEQFSPLHIESTLDMIRKEFNEGNEKLANKLMERLQFPLTLGRFIKSHQIAEQYATKLLESRMFSSPEKKEKAKEAAHRLTTGYADHGFCINLEEARNLGLEVSELEGEALDVAWDIYKLQSQKRKLEAAERRKRVKDMIKDLPPEVVDRLTEELSENQTRTRTGT